MAGEVLLINPRHRRRRKHNPKRSRRARRHNPLLMRKRHVTHRRRRHNPRRHRRHVRRNPMFRGAGVFMKGLTFVAGGIGTEVAGEFVQKWIPAAWNLDANVARIGTKAVVGIAAPMLLGKFLKLPSSITMPWLIGGIFVTGFDVFKTYLAPKLGLTLQSYEQVSSYEQLPGVNMSPGMSGLGDEQAYGEGPY